MSAPRCDHTTEDGCCPACGPDGPPHPDAPPRRYWPDDGAPSFIVSPRLGEPRDETAERDE